MDKAESLHNTLESQWETARLNNFGGDHSKTVYEEGEEIGEEEIARPSEPSADLFKDVKLGLTSVGNGMHFALSIYLYIFLASTIYSKI